MGKAFLTHSHFCSLFCFICKKWNTCQLKLLHYNLQIGSLGWGRAQFFAEESGENHFVVLLGVGKIQFHVVGGLRSPFLCWLPAGDHTYFQEASVRSSHMSSSLRTGHRSLATFLVLSSQSKFLDFFFFTLTCFNYTHFFKR